MAEQRPLVLEIKGMHCDACVRRVTASLGKVPGVKTENVEVGKASLQYDPSLADAASIAAAVRDIGFEAEALSIQK